MTVSEAARCKAKKERGDNRGLIHIDRWRMLTPASMVGTGYLRGLGLQLGESVLASAARAKKAQTIRLGSGLDALLAAPEEEPPEKIDKGQRDLERSES